MPDDRKGRKREVLRLAELKALTARWNAGARLVGEIRRSAGPRTATKALPEICKSLGIPLDLNGSDTLAQGELELPSSDVG